MIKDLEGAIGYRFRNITLLQNALTHSSYANERWHDSLMSNERLEFWAILFWAWWWRSISTAIFPTARRGS